MEFKRGRKGGAKKGERREDMRVYMYEPVCVYMLEEEKEKEEERNRGGRRR